MRALCILAALWLLLAGAVTAGEVEGQDDPRFEASLALWLTGDDASAIPEFAALAAAGNRAAQILLALIDVTPPLHGPWLAGRPRAERNALLRAPGGLSGRSWMQAAAADTALAQLLLVQPTPQASAETARDLAAMGEARAARTTLYTLSMRQYRGFVALADQPGYPPEMRYLIWKEWSAEPVTRARADAEIAVLHPGDPQLARFDRRPIDTAALDEWLAVAPLAAPLRAVCEAVCSGTIGSCTRAAFEMVGDPADVVDSHVGLSALGTPSETLVPPEVWNASPRGRAAILRQSDLRLHAPDTASGRIAVRDACLARAIAADAAGFAD